MFTTDLLFKKELIFRDHQLKKMQIKSSKFKSKSAVSLGFFQKFLVNISNPSKNKSGVSGLVD